MAQQSVDNVREKVEALFSEDPTLTDPTRIVTTVEKVGPLFKKRITVTLEGRVANAAEKRKAEQILDSNFRDSISIKNNLEIAAR